MATKGQLIEALVQSHNALLHLLDSIDPAMQFYPKWTIKEVLAHLAGWDEATTAALSSFIQGGKPDVAALKGRDAFNAESIAARAGLSLDEIFHDWEAQREQVVDTLTALPEKQLADVIAYPWGGSGSIANLLTELANHESTHAREIEARLRR
ncbi:MAG: DinB family protein [Chloroflexi bacterium]|nr:DinB family protein [Chloroflexota bacterium]